MYVDKKKICMYHYILSILFSYYMIFMCCRYPSELRTIRICKQNVHLCQRLWQVSEIIPRSLLNVWEENWVFKDQIGCSVIIWTNYLYVVDGVKSNKWSIGYDVISIMYFVVKFVSYLRRIITNNFTLSYDFILRII